MAENLESEAAEHLRFSLMLLPSKIINHGHLRRVSGDECVFQQPQLQPDGIKVVGVNLSM